MQQKKLNNKTEDITTEVRNKADIQPVERERLKYADMKSCVDSFFNDTGDYQSKQAYKRGYSCTVGEDLSNIDLLCNIYDIIYNHCVSDELSPADRKNLKDICTGLQQINRGLSQFNDNGLDKVLVSTLVGYLIKITRNYFHD